jgi:hypothetical protein
LSELKNIQYILILFDFSFWGIEQNRNTEKYLYDLLVNLISLTLDLNREKIVDINLISNGMTLTKPESSRGDAILPIHQGVTRHSYS